MAKNGCVSKKEYLYIIEVEGVRKRCVVCKRMDGLMSIFTEDSSAPMVVSVDEFRGMNRLRIG